MKANGGKHRREAQALEEEVKKLREVLEFYASANSWLTADGQPVPSGWFEAGTDMGRKAFVALQETKTPEKQKGKVSNYQREARELRTQLTLAKRVIDAARITLAAGEAGSTPAEADLLRLCYALYRYDGLFPADIARYLDEDSALFKSLAEGTMCPACQKVAQPPLANLGEAYAWAEGHPSCVPGDNK